MNKHLPIIGCALGTTLLTGMANKEALASEFPDRSSPVLYDIASPQEAFNGLARNPDMHFAYAEQILQVLERTLAEGKRRDLSSSTPGTVTMFVSQNPTDKQWIVTGLTKMDEAPYVYADNITLTTPFCGEQGRTHLTTKYRTQSDASGVMHSIITDVENTESTATWKESTNTVNGKEVQEHLDSYLKRLHELVCKLK